MRTKRLPPPQSELGEPKKKFEDTFSVNDCMKAELVKRLEKRLEDGKDNPLLGPNFNYK